MAERYHPMREEPVALNRDIMRAVKRAADTEHPLLDRRQRMRLAAALARLAEHYYYASSDEPLLFEIPTLRAVAALRRAQEQLGRAFLPQDITLSAMDDWDEPAFDVLLCGARIGWVCLDLGGMHADGWDLSPDCPLLIFAEDIPTNGPVACQEGTWVKVGPWPQWPQLHAYQRLARALGDDQIALLRDEVADEMIRRVARRITVGGDRELCVGWRPALPASAEPPLRQPRRLTPRRHPDFGAFHARRWWEQARLDAGLPV